MGGACRGWGGGLRWLHVGPGGHRSAGAAGPGAGVACVLHSHGCFRGTRLGADSDAQHGGKPVRSRGDARWRLRVRGGPRRGDRRLGDRRLPDGEDRLRPAGPGQVDPGGGPAAGGDDHAGRQVPARGGRQRRGGHQRGPCRIRGGERGARHARRTRRHRPRRSVRQRNRGGDLERRAVRVRDARIRPAGRRVQPRRRGGPRVRQRGLCRQHPARAGSGRPGRIPRRPLAVRDERGRSPGSAPGEPQGVGWPERAVCPPARPPALG